MVFTGSLFFFFHFHLAEYQCSRFVPVLHHGTVSICSDTADFLESVTFEVYQLLAIKGVWLGLAWLALTVHQNYAIDCHIS